MAPPWGNATPILRARKDSVQSTAVNRIRHLIQEARFFQHNGPGTDSAPPDGPRLSFPFPPSGIMARLLPKRLTG
jgi:hypothetical protein